MVGLCIGSISYVVCWYFSEYFGELFNWFKSDRTPSNCLFVCTLYLKSSELTFSIGCFWHTVYENNKWPTMQCFGRLALLKTVIPCKPLAHFSNLPLFLSFAAECSEPTHPPPPGACARSTSLLLHLWGPELVLFTVVFAQLANGKIAWQLKAKMATNFPLFCTCIEWPSWHHVHQANCNSGWNLGRLATVGESSAVNINCAQ